MLETVPNTKTTINGKDVHATIDGGNFGLNDIASAVTVNGEADNNSLAISDQGSQTVRTFTVTDTTINATGVPTITYTDIQNLNLTPSANVLDSLVATSGAVNVLGPAILQNVTVNGGTLITSALTADGALYESSGMTLVSDSSVGSVGVLNIDGNSTFSGGTLALQYGQVNSANPLSLSYGATLLALGSDSVNNDLVNSGAVTLAGSLTVTGFSPYATAGSLTVNGNFTQTSSGQLTVGLGGGSAAVAGSDYSQAILSGAGDTISLGGSLTVGFLPTMTAGVGTVFDIVNNQTGNPINGTFTGLAQGATLTANDWIFRISYLGGTSGHDVTLTVLQQPPVWGHVFNDSNHDGILDAGEINLDGVTVKLLNASATVVATTTTYSGGYYDFNLSTTGTYAVQVVPPAGWVFTAKGQGSNPYTTSAVNPGPACPIPSR